MKHFIFYSIYFLAILTIYSTQSLSKQESLDPLNLGEIEPQLELKDHQGKVIPSHLYQDLPYLPGEKIRFQAIHKTAISRISAGKCAILTQNVARINNRWVLGFRLEAYSAKWYEWAFLIRDTVEGFFDLENNRALYLHVDKQEGSYTQKKTAQFDYHHNRVIVKDITKGKLTFEQFKIDKEVIDPFSILYLIRRRPLEHVKEIRYTVYTSGKIYHFHAKVLGKEKVDVQDKSFETFKVKMLTKVSGALEQKGDILIYFTADQNKIPVLVEADVKIGVFALEMTSWEPGTDYNSISR